MTKVRTFVNFLINKKVIFVISICTLIHCFLSICYQIRYPVHASYVSIDDLSANDGFNPVGYFILICLDLIFIGRPNDYSVNYCSDYYVDLFVLITLFILLVVMLVFKKNNYLIISFLTISLSISNCCRLSYIINILLSKSVALMVINIIIGIILGLYYLFLGIKSVIDFPDPFADLKKEMSMILTTILIISPFLLTAVITNLGNMISFMPSYDITESTPSMVIKYLYLTSTPFWKRYPNSISIFIWLIAIYFVALLTIKKRLKKQIIEIKQN